MKGLENRLTVVFLEKNTEDAASKCSDHTHERPFTAHRSYDIYVEDADAQQCALLKEALHENETLSVSRSSVIDRPSVLVYSSC